MTASRGIGRVRIVGGRLRGSRLAVPDLPGLRPTPERLRETLFNWLQPVLPGARVLDLFAGTGALGIEALSRGAADATFVERDRALHRALRDNLSRLGLAQASLIQDDALRYLHREGRPFDIVFVDPPFAQDLWDDAVQALETDGWLTPTAWVYLEAPADRTPQVPAHWLVHRQTRAGQVKGLLYRRAGNDPLS